MTSNERVVVVGAGMAGARLAQRLGALGADVTLIGEEPHAPYNRVLLAEVLAGRYAPEVIALPRARRRAAPRRRVVRHRPRRAGRASATTARVVRVRQAGAGHRLQPGTAAAARPVRRAATSCPEGVHAFRTMDDCLALSAAVRPGRARGGRSAAGCSASPRPARWPQRGAQVVLAQQGEHLMERQLDAGASQLLPRASGGAGRGGAHRVPGARTCARARRRGPLRSSWPTATRLDADLVVLACGVRPRVGLAAGRGLDGRARASSSTTSCAPPTRTSTRSATAPQHDGVVYGLAAPALEQADVAGRRCSPGGADARYTGTRALTRLTLRPARTAPSTSPRSARPSRAPGDDVVQLADATRGTYRKVVVRGDRLVGGVLLGELGTVGALARAWEGDEPLPVRRPPAPPAHQRWRLLMTATRSHAHDRARRPRHGRPALPGGARRPRPDRRAPGGRAVRGAPPGLRPRPAHLVLLRHGRPRNSPWPTTDFMARARHRAAPRRPGRGASTARRARSPPAPG